MHDQFDISLEDSDLLGEVELTTNLIIAASESDEHLSVDEIDKILGVPPEAPLPRAAPGPRLPGRLAGRGQHRPGGQVREDVLARLPGAGPA